MKTEIKEKDYNIELARRDLFDLFEKGEITRATYDKANDMLREDRPLTGILDQMIQELGGVRYEPGHPFGGLPIISESERAKPGAHSDTCYICRDPDFAAYGLPLCRACPACSGHVAVDDSVCDDCGLDDSDFWQLVAMVKEDGQELDSNLTIYTRRMFSTSAPDYKQKDPTIKELHRATRALKRELEK